MEDRDGETWEKSNSSLCKQQHNTTEVRSQTSLFSQPFGTSQADGLRCFPICSEQ
jgi:hypothetical protein